MILIADSGSSKTEWNLITAGGEVHTVKSGGLNPYFLDENQIAEVIRREVIPSLPQAVAADEIYFYGAGCGTPAKCLVVSGGLKRHFTNAKIHVESDLFGAARSLCFRSSGLIAILGTGSNSGFYDGEKIVSQVPSLGYILGDEGSGVYLGKKILKSYLSAEMPVSLREKFNSEYKLSKDEILDTIYRQPLANRFIASFASFAGKYREEIFFNEMIESSFRSFFTEIIFKYKESRSFPLHLTGSVAWYFSSELKNIAAEMNLQLGTITQSPGPGLVKYHSG
ncbi:MAG TPA: hypothetical protein PLU53_00700 [Bacteroidia bacterium]|nr:hypothetical protein [Bacteroidia bacterium]